jgi:hypothetical protein
MSRVNKKKEIMKYYSLSMEVSQKTRGKFNLKIDPHYFGVGFVTRPSVSGEIYTKLIRLEEFQNSG